MDLEQTIRSLVEARGLEFVDAGFARQDGRRVLRVTLDREGGIDLDTIAEVSEALGRRLDEANAVVGPYTLEVSSPGVERPLRTPRDFARGVGERVKVKTGRAIDGARVLRGTIVSAGPHEVQISTDRGPRSLSYDDIASARTIFEWSDDK